jgi:methionyl-tRNA formyltransferase
MGTPSYATNILKTLINHDSIEVVALFTQEDKPVGRKQILTPPDVKKYIIENDLDIPIFQPKKLRDEENVLKIKELNPNFIVVAAYGQILPKSILKIAPCINLHASILPKYRGASPIQDAIKNGDNFSGVTAMLMDEGLDTGDILGFSYIDIKDMDAPTLFEKLSFLASDLTVEVLLNFKKIKPLKQNPLLATYCKKIKKEDGFITFDNAKKIYQKYLAYLWWPNIFLESGLKLKKITLCESETNNKEGEILKIESESITVGCKKGSLKIFLLQPPSKKEMKAVDYLRGKRLSVGDTLF